MHPLFQFGPCHSALTPVSLNPSRFGDPKPYPRGLNQKLSGGPSLLCMQLRIRRKCRISAIMISIPMQRASSVAKNQEQEQQFDQFDTNSSASSTFSEQSQGKPSHPPSHSPTNLHLQSTKYPTPTADDSAEVDVMANFSVNRKPSWWQASRSTMVGTAQPEGGWR